MIEPPGWDDDRLGAAFEGLAGRSRRTPSVREVMDAVRATPQKRRGIRGLHLTWSRPRVIAAALVVVLLAAVVLVQVRNAAPSGAQSAQPAGHLAVADIALDYPADWFLYDQLRPGTGFGQTLAILTTTPWDQRCPVGELNCFYQQKLQPGGMAITIGVGTYEQTIFDRAAADHRSTQTVAGMPAESSTGAEPGNPYQADDEIWWTIARPTSPFESIVVDAVMRNPGAADARAQVEAMVAGLRFTPTPAGIDEGSGGATASAAALANGLEALDRSLRGSGQIPTGARTVYDCVPRDSGVWRQSAITYGPDGWLGGALQVECSASIEPVAGRWWRLTVRVTAVGNTDQRGQTYVETDWLLPDATPAGATSEGYIPTTRIDPGSPADRARAVRTAIDDLASQSDFFACFPEVAGQSRDGTLASDPNGVTLASQLPVTCTTAVEAAADQHAWILSLDASWQALPGFDPGRITYTVDVSSTGHPAGNGVLSGDPLPGPFLGGPTPRPSAP